MLKALLYCCSIGLLTPCEAYVTFTNLKCSYTNITFGEFTKCYIKAVNRTHKYITVYGKLNFRPIDNLTINLKVMRYDHGYKPFFIDITFDACKFLRDQRRNPIINLFYKTIKERSNMNHTCPYDHDIIVDKLWSGNHDRAFYQYLPVPNNDYAIYGTFYAYNVEISKVYVYLKITN